MIDARHDDPGGPAVWPLGRQITGFRYWKDVYLAVRWVDGSRVDERPEAHLVLTLDDGSEIEVDGDVKWRTSKGDKP